MPQSGFIDLPDAASSPTSLSVSGGVQLMDGDRIIGDNNKIRLRVTSLLASRLRIINTPSVLAVGSRDIDTGQFNRRHRIQVYQVRTTEY